jgi:Cft2 family RNA processing exonuclease
MPISAFGNVQELLLILDEHWHTHPELHNIPIFYASGLAFRGMQVYRTYIHTMNDHVKSRFSRDRNDNPFAFKYVRNVKDFRKWKDSGPCVMMATPQMLQGYHSRELLEQWAPDRKNGLIITGYSIEGTMAKVSADCRPLSSARKRRGLKCIWYGKPHDENDHEHVQLANVSRLVPFRCPLCSPDSCHLCELSVIELAETTGRFHWNPRE